MTTKMLKLVHNACLWRKKMNFHFFEIPIIWYCSARHTDTTGGHCCEMWWLFSFSISLLLSVLVVSIILHNCSYLAVRSWYGWAFSNSFMQLRFQETWRFHGQNKWLIEVSYGFLRATTVFVDSGLLMVENTHAHTNNSWRFPVFLVGLVVHCGTLPCD